MTDTPGLADIELFAGLDEAALTAAVDGLRSEPWAASQPQVRCFAIEDAVVHLVDRARMAGAVRESVTIALGRLAEAGEIEVRNRTLTIRVPDQPPAETLRRRGPRTGSGWRPR